MAALDYYVLIGYFLLMIAIGIYCTYRVKAQEDFFMGGRGFGKLLQTFAAFGAGTGSSDPVNTGRTTFTNGLSGMWSVMYWLFVTPFYWITGVWYRRMRHLTLGDWFVERYQSKLMGAAYALFGLFFMMVYGAMLFSAIGKVAAPLMGFSTFEFQGNEYNIEYLLVPVIAVVVLVYGIAGGLRAAYYTDLIQGLCIIALSIILIPYGLEKLVQTFGNPDDGMMAGFKIIHERLPETHFTLFGSTSSEFPWYRLVAVVLINLVGIVVQPHFIATGGGSAKTETNARVGLVVGNFLKRFCTVGWVLTALIALTLFADSPELVEDPDRVWGYASKQILKPGLVGLMLACLLAALMSSVDAYMVVGSGLVVRNIYVAYVNPRASETECIRVGRLTGIVIVAGAVTVSMTQGMDVFKLLQYTWIVPVLFAATFWVGMYWRRASTLGAWVTILFSATTIMILPKALPIADEGLRENQDYALYIDYLRKEETRTASPSDVSRRKTERDRWDKVSKAAADAKELANTALKSMKTVNDADSSQVKSLQEKLTDYETKRAALKKLGGKPQELKAGQEYTITVNLGGKSIFWTKGLKPVDPKAKLEEVETREDGWKVLRYPEGTEFTGAGDFRLDNVLYLLMLKKEGMQKLSSPVLATLELPAKIVLPFLVMIIFSFITPRNSKEALDRYYTKMKVPVLPDPAADERQLDEAYANPDQFKHKKLFGPNSSLEVSTPTMTDVVGFVLCFAACFGIIWLALFVANLGG